MKTEILYEELFQDNYLQEDSSVKCVKRDDRPARAKVMQVFNFLLELKELTGNIVREIGDYKEKIWWQRDLPLGEGCYLKAKESDPEIWLEIHKQKIPPPPAPPSGLADWIENSGSTPDNPPTHKRSLCLLSYDEIQEMEKLPLKIRELEQQSKKFLQEQNRGKLQEVQSNLTNSRSRYQKLEAKRNVYFEDYSGRVRMWEDWLNTKWKPWAEYVIPLSRVQKLYGELFALYQRLQKEKEILELVWGHGLLTWETQGRGGRRRTLWGKKDDVQLEEVTNLKIIRPVLTTRVELRFDEKRGIFYICPTQMGTLLELDMLKGINLPNPEILVGMERDVSGGMDPFDENLTRSFFQELVNVLSPEGSAELDKEITIKEAKCHNYPTIYNAGVLFLRRDTGKLYQKDLKDILETVRNGHSLPETILSLVSEEIPKPDEKSINEWKTIGEDLLFPLPSNEEQKEIVRRLAKNFGVVVQGPPGTGKSHTIVNLIAHLLSHGKRVLVTGYAERALKVLGNMLRDKLPEISPLCVSVLGGDVDSMKELEASITKISENLASIDSESVQKKIDQLRKEFTECRKEIARLKYELRQSAEWEEKTVSIDNREMRPIEVAQWLSENEAIHSWFPDPIRPDEEPPLSDKEMVRLYELIGILSKQDREHLGKILPDPTKLPDPSRLRELFTNLESYKNSLESRQKKLLEWTLPSTPPSNMERIPEMTDKVLKMLESVSKPWLQSILHKITHSASLKKEWLEFVESCQERIDIIREKNRILSDFVIDAPKNISFQKVREHLKILETEFINNDKISFWFRYFSGGHTLYIIDSYKINKLPANSAKDIKILTEFIDREEILIKLTNKWNNTIALVGGPRLDSYDGKLIMQLEEYISNIRTVLEWENDYLNPLLTAVKDIKFPGEPSWNSIDWLRKFREGIIAYSEILSAGEMRKYLESLIDYIKKEINNNSSPLWQSLLKSLETQDLKLWEKTLGEIKRLEELKPKVQELNQLRNKLNNVAPRWIAQIEMAGGKGTAIIPPENWKDAWLWKQIESWHKDYINRVRPEEIQEKLDSARRKEGQLIEKLVSLSTWLEQIKRTTDPQKKSLFAWLQIMRKIGKGTGKYAPKHRMNARREMINCRDAVPVWIMPLNRVVENLKADGKPFDVIIVDESSQADLFSLQALFRAKRAVIVGDDNQISPEGVGKDQSEVNQLIERHLIGIPHKNLFTFQDSLYDTSMRLFPGKLMLKEHFRCVPDIIQFCNDMFYGGEIVTLRIPQGEDALTPPVVAVRVKEGYREENSKINKPEAEALTEKILELCKNPLYKDKTMGVISLLGEDQANLIDQMLREKLGEIEMVRRRLICGDAYSFQGDERNIMFLSMVVASNVRIGSLNRRADHQRFNVAVSRAKDQLWLFHSVDLDSLSPNCIRRNLLQYCLDPSRTPIEIEKAEAVFQRYASSKFHQEVYRLIVARGYRAIPEFKVGKYRIDIVIEGIGSRLAVECDGDQWHGIDKWEEDMERQTILERVGWKFWRVRGSVFYRDKNKSMEPLWKILTEMNIHPR